MIWEFLGYLIGIVIISAVMSLTYTIVQDVYEYFRWRACSRKRSVAYVANRLNCYNEKGKCDEQKNS